MRKIDTWRASSALAIVALGYASDAHAAPLSCNEVTLRQFFESKASTSAVEYRDDYAVVDSAKLEGDVCIVRGRSRARQNIRFELRLPSKPRWNNRFFFHGGSGTDGFVPAAKGNKFGAAGYAVDDGYAVVSTDSGHDSLGNWFQLFTEPYSVMSTFGREPELRVDYGSRALELVTRTAKKFVSLYYDDGIHNSFFVGCSNGGRQAMMAAKNLPHEFDGILAGAPAMNISRQVFQAVGDVKALSKISDTPGAALTDSEMRYVASKIVAACDGLDGADDGMVSDPVGCQDEFDPQSLKISWTNLGGLPARKVDALIEMMAGPRAGGQPIYASWQWDPGIAANMYTGASWRTWRMESAFGLAGGKPYPIAVFLGAGALANLVMSPPEPAASTPGTAAEAWRYLKNYNLETGFPKSYTTTDSRFAPSREVLDVPHADQLGVFEQSQGKLVVFSGSSDGAVATNDVIAWHTKLKAADAQAGRNTDAHVRLYVLPGVGHCGSGRGTDSFDLFSVLEDWVVKGVAPSDDAPPHGHVSSGNLDAVPEWRGVRSRPLCSYPRIAVPVAGYDPSRDVNLANKFECVIPQ